MSISESLQELRRRRNATKRLTFLLLALPTAAGAEPLIYDERVSVLPVDTANGACFGHLGFDPNYRPVRLRVLEDINGNGSEEIAVMAVRRGSGNRKVWIEDVRSGQSIRVVYLGKQYIGEDLASSRDINGNDTPELVVPGRREDGKLRAIIKDSKTGALISSVGF